MTNTTSTHPPRRFTVVRDVDETGVSGTGIVAYGVQFADGTAVLRWATGLASTAVYASVEDLIAIHGHGGKTRLEWIDHAVPGVVDPDPLRPDSDLTAAVTAVASAWAEESGYSWETLPTSMQLRMRESALSAIRTLSRAGHPIAL